MKIEFDTDEFDTLFDCVDVYVTECKKNIKKANGMMLENFWLSELDRATDLNKKLERLAEHDAYIKVEKDQHRKENPELTYEEIDRQRSEWKELASDYMNYDYFLTQKERIEDAGQK